MGAALALGHMRKAALPAVPALSAALNDKDIPVRCHAAQALWRIDPARAKAALPVLVRALADKDDNIRLGATITLARALGHIAPKADAEARWSAAEALGHIGPEAGAAVSALVAALKDGQDFVRWQAAAALGGIGPRGKDGDTRAHSGVGRFFRARPTTCCRSLRRHRRGSQDRHPSADKGPRRSR